MNKSTLNAFAVLAGFISSICFANEATQQCENVYKDNITQYSSESQIAYAIEEIAKNECNSDGTSLNVGYSEKSKSLLGSISNTAKNFFGSYSKTSAFCSDYQSGKFSFYSGFASQKQPLMDMAKQFNACMQIASTYNYAVWNSWNGPSEVVFHGQYYLPGNTGIFFNTSVMYNGADCFTPEKDSEVKFPRGVMKEVKNEFTLACRRTGYDNETSTVYRAANILITFNGQPYPIDMPADRVYFEPGDGPKSSDEARKSLAELQAQLTSSKKSNQVLEAEITTEKNKVFFQRLVYVGQQGNFGMPGASVLHNTVPNIQDGQIIHFSCDFKNMPNRGRLDARNDDDRKTLGNLLHTRVCGNNNRGGWTFISHAEGNECGYESYIMNCET